ncbi:hypothetical protein [Vulcanococcus limneticus]|uniref:hypothetical protein n=1 Tax=Vulcanococcus limneticus TaxID=2170428 RepID=UPI00398C10EB
MDQPFAQTLSFDDLEVLALVEDGGATPRELADSLDIDLHHRSLRRVSWCGGAERQGLRTPRPENTKA